LWGALALQKCGTLLDPSINHTQWWMPKQM